MERAADRARLHLDEVADVHVLGELGAGTQARVRTDAAVGADVRLLEVAEGLDLGCPRRTAHVAQHAVRADRDAVAQHDVALEHAVHVDGDVAPALELARARRCAPDRRASRRRPAAPAHDRAWWMRSSSASSPLQFTPSVSATACGCAARTGTPSATASAIDVGQVVLALGVVVAQPRRASRRAGRSAATMMPVLTSRIARSARVASFCSTMRFTRPAARARCGRSRWDRRARRSARATPVPGGLAQARERLRAGAAARRRRARASAPPSSSCGSACSTRVAGAELRLLAHPGDRRRSPRRLAHAPRRRGRTRRRSRSGASARAVVEDVASSGRPASGCSTLGRSRVHPLALAGGEDDDVHCATFTALVCRYWLRGWRRC